MRIRKKKKKKKKKDSGIEWSQFVKESNKTKLESEQITQHILSYFLSKC
jgi:hypothetical protein